MTFRKLFLPPLVPVGMLLMFLVWDLVSRITGDDAITTIGLRDARNLATAGMFHYALLLLCNLAMAGLFYYTVFLLCNLADAGCDCFRTRGSWLGTGALVLFCGGALALAYHPALVDNQDGAGKTLAIATGMGFGIALVVIVPMAFVRRHVMGNKRGKRRII